MKSARFFVTAVLFISTALLMACDAYHSTKATSQPADVALTSEQAGNAKLEQAMLVQAELSKSFSIVLGDLRDPRGQIIKGSSLAMDYEWRALTKAQRGAAKEKLAHFLALAFEVLEIDARKGLYVTNKERVISSRDAALGFQKSLENFEKIVGENFEPKPGRRPIAPYTKSYEV